MTAIPSLWNPVKKMMQGPELQETQQVTPPAVVEPPPVEEKEVERIAEEEKETLKKKKKGTILTGPRGVLEPANVSYKTLLG